MIWLLLAGLGGAAIANNSHEQEAAIQAAKNPVVVQHVVVPETTTTAPVTQAEYDALLLRMKDLEGTKDDVRKDD